MAFTDTFSSGAKHAPTHAAGYLFLWCKTLIFGLFVYMLISISLHLQRHLVGTELINISAAWAAVVLIGFSMLLSVVCYFLNMFDRYILYRKHLGVIGFLFATVHVLFSLVILRHEFPFPGYYLSQENRVSFMFAALAFIYFAFMAAISNNYAIHEIGGVHWRRLLRVGYLAYIFAIIHFGIKGLPWWTKWIQKGMPMPPPIGFILFICALFVPYLRLVLEIALRK